LAWQDAAVLPSRIATTDYHTGGEPFRIVVDPPVRAGTMLRHDSIVGSTFTGTVLDSIDVDGPAAVIPQVTGMAYRTGEHAFSIDPYDPLVPGFLLR
jgi:proline racemase